MPFVQRQPINSIVIIEVFNNTSSVIFTAKNPGGLGVRRSLERAAKTADSLIVIYDDGKMREFKRTHDDPDMLLAIGQFMKKMYAARDVLKMAKARRYWSVTARGLNVSIAERPDGRYFMRYQAQGERLSHWREHNPHLIDGKMTWEGLMMDDLSGFPINILLPI